MSRKRFTSCSPSSPTPRDDMPTCLFPFDYSVYYPTFLNSPENYDSRLLLERYF